MKQKDGSTIFIILLTIISFIVLVSFVSGTSIVQDLSEAGSQDLSGISEIIATIFYTDIVAQILIFVLVFLVIYSISPFIPFISNKKWISFLISIIVALLSILYLRPEEVRAAIAPYPALGFAITAIIPFIAIAVISKRLYEEKYIFLSKALWIGFLVFTLITWISTDFGDNAWIKMGIYPVILVLSLLMLLFERWIYFKVFKMVLKGELGEAQKALYNNYAAQLQRNLELQRSATGKVMAGLQQEEIELREKIAKVTLKRL